MGTRVVSMSWLFVAMNFGVHVSFQFRVFIFSEYMPRRGIAGSYGSSFSRLFKETPYCFPQWLYQFILPASYKSDYNIEVKKEKEKNPAQQTPVPLPRMRCDLMSVISLFFNAFTNMHMHMHIFHLRMYHKYCTSFILF